MSSITTTRKSGLNLGEMALLPLRAAGRFFVALAESSSRAREIEQLSALSDAELARRGLERQDIVRYVFRDRMGL